MKRLISIFMAVAVLLAVTASPALAGNREDYADNFALGLNEYNETHCGGYDVDISSNRENLVEWRAQQRADSVGGQWPDAHTDPSGNKVWDYAEDFAVRDWTGAGEIVANLQFMALDGNGDPVDSDSDGIFNGTEQIIQAWHDSTQHRNIMQTCSYDSFGAGVWVKPSGELFIHVIYTNQPLKYANASGGVGVWSDPAASCGSSQLGTVPNNARLIQYDHKTSTCDGVLWYFVRYQETGLTGWVKSTKVTSSP
jgi:hypothetical protein